MTRDEKIKNANLWVKENQRFSGCGTPIVMATVLLLVVILSSCATRTKIEYRDRDVNHYITNYVRDTLIDRTTDSIYFEVFTKGDTVFKTKYKERIQWRDRIVERHDTCYRDSVQVEYNEKVVEVVKIPKIYHAALIFSIISIIFASIKLARWLKIR